MNTLLEELPDILTTGEVRRVLRVSRNTLYAEVRTGRLPVIKLGDRVWRFSRFAVEKWIEAQGAKDVAN